MKIPVLKLSSGTTIPTIGFGTWQLAEGQEVEESVEYALKVGYRLIDTAKIYGNEYGVGQAVKRSGIPRAEVFVTTKLWNSDQGYDSALKAFEDSLHKLEMEYVDLYLIHWPSPGRLRYKESWRALTQIYQDGRAKAVGVSNFDVHHLEDLMSDSALMPAVNQIEFHPYIYKKQAPILDFCKAHGVVVEAYSPLAHGRQTDNPVLELLAKKHGKTNAQVMLRWAIQHGIVPIPKSATLRRIEENSDVFDFKLSPKEIQAIDGLSDDKSSLPFLVRLLK